MRIFFMAFDRAGQTPLVKKLRAAGHKVALSEPRFPAFFDLLKQQQPPPEVFLVDCSTQASHARDASSYVVGLKVYKGLPFLLYNVKAEDEAKTREKVPSAKILRDDKVDAALAALTTASGAAA